MVGYHTKYIVRSLAKENCCIISLMLLCLLCVVAARAHIWVLAHLTFHLEVFPLACGSKKLENLFRHSFFFFLNIVKTRTALLLHLFFQ
jgi:hypothetical protein